MKMGNTSDSAENLPAIGVLKRLSPQIRGEFSKYGTFETLPHGAYVATQGNPHAKMSVVLSGELKVSCHAHGDTVELASLKPGDLVGEVSLIDAHHSSADVIVTNQDADMWTIDKTSTCRRPDS